MKTLYLECNMGAAGDMLMSALMELHKNPQEFIQRFNHLGIPKVKIVRGKSEKCGICGTHMRVTVDGVEEESHQMHLHHLPHSHEHHSLHHIEHLIADLDINEDVKKDAIGVYTLIAEAESHVHGKPVSDIHFHEVGIMDAVADVVAVCMLLHELNIQRIVSSPVNVGRGQVKCAHGILPVPAPATSFILKDVPIYSGNIEGELCTPTGAALLKYFVESFDSMPVMKVNKIGYGMGSKDFPVANCVRAMLGETESRTEDIVELCCNLDDITPESIGYVTELLMKEGALDVYTTSVLMKKNRPGFVLTCMCKKEDKEKFLKQIFKHTTTLGIREYICNRYTLERNVKEADVSYGTVRIKESKGYGVEKQKIEYEDLVKIADSQDMSIEEVREKINQEIFKL